MKGCSAFTAPKRILGLLAVAATVLLLLAPAVSSAGFQLHSAKESLSSFRAGRKIVTVWEFTPKESKGPFPGIVMLYGLEGLDELAKVQLLYKTVAGKIAEKGYVVHFVLYFECSCIQPKDVAGLKDDMRRELLNQKPKADARCESYYRAWMGAVRDSVTHLRTHPKVNKDKIALVGFSMGGFVATSTAVEYDDLRLSAIVNAFGGLPDRHHLQLRQSKKKMAPILIFAGQEDDIVPEKFGRDLQTLMRETGNKSEAHFYHGLGHMFYDPTTGGVNQDIALNEALPTALRFLGRALK
jgi:dienelactone hydrolase